MLKREATICSLNVVTKKSRELMVTLTTTSSSLGTMMILMASTIQTKEEVGEAITKADCRMTGSNHRGTREVTEEADRNRINSQKDPKIVAKQEAAQRSLLDRIGLLI